MSSLSDDVILLLGAGSILALHLSGKGARRLTNYEHLDKIDIKYRDKFRGFVGELKQIGLSPVIISSKRGLIKQSYEKFKDPRNASPGQSKHNKRMAIDLQVKFQGKYLNKKTPKATWISSGVPAIAKKYGLKWGGEIPGYYDPVHYEAV